jgi:hypothetical protein
MEPPGFAVLCAHIRPARTISDQQVSTGRQRARRLLSAQLALALLLVFVLVIVVWPR